MSLGHGAKTLKIVKDKLLINLDFSNPACYQEGEVIVKDLATTYDASLNNGIMYSSDDGGSFIFDGVNDIINFGTSPATDSVAMTGDFTLEIVFKPTGYQPTKYYGLTNVLLYRGNMSVYNYQIQVTNSTTISFTKRGTTESLRYHHFTVPDMTDRIIHAIFVIESNTTIKCYINGVLINSLSIGGTPIESMTGDMPFAIGHTGSRNAEGDTEFIGQVYTARIYNKPLSTDEVQINYLAMSGRYGI